jgi:hypothetical protein
MSIKRTGNQYSKHEAPLLSGEPQSVVIPVADEVDPDTGDVILFRGSFLKEPLHGYFQLRWYFTCFVATLMYGIGTYHPAHASSLDTQFQSSSGLLAFVFFTPLYRVKTRRRVESMEFYVTSRAVVFKETAYSMGCCLAKTTEKHVMLDNITDVAYDQGFVQKMKGIATIKVENPGQSGTGENASGSDLAVTGLANPHLVKRVLLQLRHRVRYGMQVDVPTVRSIVDGEIFSEMKPVSGGVVDAMRISPVADMAPVCEILGRIEQLLQQQQQQQPPVPHASVL